MGSGIEINGRTALPAVEPVYGYYIPRTRSLDLKPSPKYTLCERFGDPFRLVAGDCVLALKIVV